MNKYYSYPDIDIWQNNRWQNKLGCADTLIQWIEAHNQLTKTNFVPPSCDDPHKHPHYREKTHGIDLPEVIQHWAEKGLRYTSLEQGRQDWISMVPEKALLNRSRKLPLLVSFFCEDTQDPWYTMKTMAYYQKYNDMLAKSQDFIIIYVIGSRIDTDRIYINLMQEACILYPVDLDCIYLDLSPVAAAGVKLKDIPDFIYIDKKGNKIEDPDSCIERFGTLNLPVIDISGRWGDADSLSRGLVMTYRMNEGRFNREWFLHSGVARRSTEGLLMENHFTSVDNEGFAEYWDNMGLLFEQKETNGERWLAFVPKQAVEEPEKKLPTVMLMQEVYHGNEHLAVTSLSYFYEYMHIAAQGECILLFFAMEDWDSNDLFVTILHQAESKYPIDSTRVYITGHSHDGCFTFEFARRHPDIIAAAATLGNAGILQPPEVTGDKFLSVGDDRLETMSKIDMPMIVANAMSEGHVTAPDNPEEFAAWAKFWQRRLIASRCPMKTPEEIRAARYSKNKAERILGFPADHAETIWADGAEHYVADVTNIDGNNHLRVVTSENMPHTVTPFMIDITWNFLRKFSRNQETGEIIELQ